jgi:hypothetical protein
VQPSPTFDDIVDPRHGEIPDTLRRSSSQINIPPSSARSRVAMPNAGVHLLLVHDLLERWRDSPGLAPFPARDVRAARAFAHGALAPDIGYFPGGDRLFSELAHLVGSADLARELTDRACTPEQQGYAWGWVTHVLADGAIHPLLNEAGGEHRHGDRSRAVSSTDDVRLHMRLEYGLDAAVFARAPRLDGVRCDGQLEPDTIDMLADAYRSVYGWTPPARSLTASHRMSARLARIALSLNRLHSATMRARPAHRIARAIAGAAAVPLRALPIGYRDSTVMRAVLEPIPSPMWLIDEALSAIAQVTATLHERCEIGLHALRNRNLITGVDSSRDGRDRRTLDAMLELEARRQIEQDRIREGLAVP